MKTLRKAGLFALAMAALASGRAEARLATFDVIKAHDGKTASRYFDDNYDLILQDLAAGGGAYVDALGAVFACPAGLQTALAKVVARRVSGRALDALETPQGLMTAVARAARTRKALVEKCGNIPEPDAT